MEMFNSYSMLNYIPEGKSAGFRALDFEFHIGFPQRAPSFPQAMSQKSAREPPGCQAPESSAWNNPFLLLLNPPQILKKLGSVSIFCKFEIGQVDF